MADHPRASAFHQRGWLAALSRTYGYRPLALTSAPPDTPLSDGVLLAFVSSWITGKRLVSLPFSDHCEPLTSNDADLADFLTWLKAECERRQCKYVELRPVSAQASPGFQPSGSYWFHRLALRPDLQQLFMGLHKDSFQRRIRHAEKQKLVYEKGNSEELVCDFYRLLLLTRRRHRLLPQPRAWFKNLLECFGEQATIRLARSSGVPVAAIFTLRHRNVVVYKYGCSDAKFHHLAGMPFLFWRLIEESKAEGVQEIDLGRSDLNDQGLVDFKDKFGATKTALTYYRYPGSAAGQTQKGRSLRWIGKAASLLPDAVLAGMGSLAYRHAG